MTPLVKVYGFPRSGNHLVMTLLAQNFYGRNLDTPGGMVGHWADRVPVPPVKYGQLSGHHGPPDWGVEHPAIYVYRDGRAVAASLWRSPHFKHPRWKRGAFTDFLHASLDWAYTPGQRAWPGQNVIEHWVSHLQSWVGQDALWVQYEALCANPQHFLEMFQYRFDLPRPDKWTIPHNLVGHFPSGGAHNDSWRDLWSEEDERWFFDIVPTGFCGIAQEGE